MKEYYSLMKVVDPHHHMSKGIRDHLFDGMRLRDDSLNNDSFIRWTVGSEKDEYDASEEKNDEEYESDPDDLEYEEELEEDELEEAEDEYEQSLFHLAKVDEWLLKHDFKKGEEIIVLFWW
jgi:hypothetical protein